MDWMVIIMYATNNCYENVPTPLTAPVVYRVANDDDLAGLLCVFSFIFYASV